jgi:hypothetical protein
LSGVPDRTSFELHLPAEMSGWRITTQAEPDYGRQVTRR